MNSLSIGGVELTTDEAGRFNLSALTKAAKAQGVTKDIRPNEWLALEGTAKMAEILITENPQMEPIVTTVGRYGGTFVHQLLAVSFAGWISPAFQLKVNQAFIDVRTGRIAFEQLPLPNKLKAVGDVMHGFSRLAGLLGLKGNQRALSAAMATRRETGVDVLQLTGITHLEAEVQDQFITPTQIALRVDPASTAQKINAALESLGFQIERRRVRKGADRHDYWELTDAGKAAGGEYFDTTKKRSDGTPVKQIRWPVSAVAKVQHHLAGDRT